MPPLRNFTPYEYVSKAIVAITQNLWPIVTTHHEEVPSFSLSIFQCFL